MARESITRFADTFAAIGAEPRLEIMRRLLSAHPDGLVVGEIQEGVGLANSTLSHHLEKLKNHRLATATRKRRSFGIAPTRPHLRIC